MTLRTRNRTIYVAVAALMVAVAMACLPPSAQAAVAVTVTNDSGQPTVLDPAAPPTLRNMSVEAAIFVAADDGASYRWSVTGPDGIAAATGAPCWTGIRQDSRRTAFRGNGTYTLTLATFSQTRCAGSAKATLTYRWSVAASVGIGQPAPLMTRSANSAGTNTHLLDFTGNPGATTYEIRYAKGAVLAADGSISGPGQSAYIDSTTGKIRFSSIDGPGIYTVVARAKSGDFFTPWSTPVNVTLLAPFDLRTTRFTDRRGPSYQVYGEVREPSAAGGRVTIALARGKHGKRFRTLGRARINSRGGFKLRFRLRKVGWCSIRYSYRGSQSVQRGTAYVQVRFRRVIA